jgi:hypothetical protein
VLVLKTVYEPTPCRPRRAVGPINCPHFYQASSGRRILGRDLNECAARKVRLDKMQRQGAKPETRAQECKLGPEVGKAPDSRDLKTGFVASRNIGRIDVRKLNMFGED